MELPDGLATKRAGAKASNGPQAIDLAPGHTEKPRGMTSLLSSFARAFAQLGDRRILWLLLKSLLVTLVLFVLVGVGLYLGLMWLVDAGLGAWLDDLPPDFAEVIATIGTILAVVLGGWLLFRLTALAAIQFFADDVVEVVEAKYYPEALESARRIGFAESMWISFKGAVRTILINILILPLALILLVTGFGTVLLFAVVNAWLLGRDLRDMAWQRHRHNRDDEPPIGRGTRFAMGLIIAGMLAIPGLNFLAPIIGAAAATHLVQGRMRDA